MQISSTRYGKPSAAIVDSTRFVSSASTSGACWGVVTARISTLSNSCVRNIPRVSRPAEPASRRKQEVWAIYRNGRSSALRISPACKLVNGTSAVGMHHKSSRSIENASSANFGNWPVAVSVLVKTKLGGRISSNASALRSSAS